MCQKNEVFKVCSCCGQRKVLAQFRPISRSEMPEGCDRSDLRNYYSNVCNICVKNGMPTKEMRLQKYRSVLAAAKVREAARLAKMRDQELAKEDDIF